MRQSTAGPPAQGGVHGEGAAGDRTVGGQPGHPVGDGDRLAAEFVVAVGHPGGGHGVGDRARPGRGRRRHDVARACRRAGARRRRPARRPRRRASSRATIGPGSRWWIGRIALKTWVPTRRAGLDRRPGSARTWRRCGRSRRPRRGRRSSSIASMAPGSSGAMVTIRTAAAARCSAASSSRSRVAQVGRVLRAAPGAGQVRALEVHAGQHALVDQRRERRGRGPHQVRAAR